MRYLAITSCLMLALSGSLIAKTQTWEPSPGHTQVPIWPKGGVPKGQGPTGPESMERGKLCIGVYNVTRPTMTVYRPTGRNTGAAVIVFPGGGYEGLAIDLEGTEVCDWLTARGVTCVLLKYRVPHAGEHWDNRLKRHVMPKTQMALQDAQRTLSLVRFNAAKWHIDPHKIGVLGFSAGGHMVAATSTHFAHRSYAPADAVDRFSCRPDFGVALYPGHISRAEDSIELKPDIRDYISKQTPPTFLLQNEDDPVDRVENCLSYFAGLKKAGVPVEMHLYAHGGHAFGLRPSKFPVSKWPRLVETWLETIGMVSSQSH